MLNIFFQLLSDNRFQTPLGWAMVIAILVSGLLNEDTRDYLRWVGAVLFFAATLVFVRVTYLSHVGAHLASSTQIAYSITILVTIAWIIGGLLGWFISCMARKRARKNYKVTNGG